MLSPIATAIVFAESFTVYSLLRQFDVRSTRKLAERIDLQKHEVNPLLTFLTKRLSLNTAFRATWVLTASAIALSDTYLNTVVSWGVPAIALLFGTIHLLAAASNMELEYRTRSMSPAEIEADTYEFAKQLSGLNWKGRLSLLAERYAFNVVVTAISLVTIVGFELSDTISKLTHSSNSGAVMSNAALLNMMALLFFFPTVFFGTLIWSRRLVKFYDSGKLDPPQGHEYSIEIPIAVAEEALNLANSKQASTIRLLLDHRGATEGNSSMPGSNQPIHQQ